MRYKNFLTFVMLSFLYSSSPFLASAEEKHVNRFKQLVKENLMDLLVTGVKEGKYNYLHISVNDLWYEGKPHQKRTMAAALLVLWKKARESEDASIIIYDKIGHKVASGTKPEKIWIEKD